MLGTFSLLLILLFRDCLVVPGDDGPLCKHVVKHMYDVCLAHASELLVVRVLGEDVRTLRLTNQAEELEAVHLRLGSLGQLLKRIWDSSARSSLDRLA